MKRLNVAHLILSLAFLLPIFTEPAFALTPSEVFEKVKDSVLVVKTFDAQGKPKSQGSGVMLPSGKVATNCHVVRNGERFQVGRGKNFIPATLHAADSDKDLCLLEVNGLTAKPVQLGKASALKVGVAVYAVGSPKRLELSLSDGIVSQLRGAAPPLIQTTTAISPGSSGGGLFNVEGRLVGITTFYLEGGQSLNFALPVEWLASIQTGKKQKGAQGRSQADWIARAAALEQKKNWQELLDWSRQWTRADPGNAMAWVALGEASAWLNLTSDAIEAYRKALHIKPDYATAWYYLGNVYDDLNRDIDAIEAYREALRIEPDYAEAWNNLGTNYGRLEQYTDAIQAIRESLRIKPDLADSWNNLGFAYLKLNRNTDAIEAYREVLRIKPDHSMAWYYLALAYAKSGNRAAALEAVRELRRYDPQKADELFNRIMPR